MDDWSRFSSVDFVDENKKKHARKVIASVIPIVPFKGIQGFMDIGGLLANPRHLHLTFQMLLHEIQIFQHVIDSIGCFDARGFLFAPFLGVQLKKKVFMLRKPDKMPNVSDTIEYFKEYKGDNQISGGDHLSIQQHAVKEGEKVLLVDDVLATGGTVEAGIKLVQKAGGKIVACAFIAEIKALNGRQRAIEAVTSSLSSSSLSSSSSSSSTSTATTTVTTTTTFPPPPPPSSSLLAPPSSANCLLPPIPLIVISLLSEHDMIS
jgi:adenine phosphoribosyltransferase